MAITINAGGSKKVSQNYDSQGVSLTVTAEVPNDALNDHQQIANTANGLFDLVNQLLDEQIAKVSQGEAKPTNSRSYAARSRGQSRGQSNGNGNSGGNRSRSNGRSNNNNGGNTADNQDRQLTQAQQRAIKNMVRRLDEDGDAWVRHEFGLDKIGDLTVRQASEFIDVLKQAIGDQQPQESR